jgi:hypothetical protein
MLTGISDNPKTEQDASGFPKRIHFDPLRDRSYAFFKKIRLAAVSPSIFPANSYKDLLYGKRSFSEQFFFKWRLCQNF